jgi:predicted kinase
MIWATERNRQQGQLIAEMYRAGAAVPCERRAVIAGGLPGAAKDDALERHGVSRSQYLTISIDGVLAEMAARRLIPAVAGLSPLAAADLVHAEAQHVAKRIGLLALTDGRNVILDISLVSRRAAESWTYALRFADYAVTAVFADISTEESVTRSAAAHRRGEEEYQRGRGHGGRYIPPAAIRALTGPAVAGARSSIAWASGAEPAGIAAGRPGGGLRGGAVAAMISAYRRGQLSLDGLGLEFRVRRWPEVPSACPPGLEEASAAIDDPEPYVPGSFDDVVLAYDQGQLSDEEYEYLAGSAA